jgi:hypothetical protein
LNICFVALGAALILLALASIAEALWMGGIHELIEPNTIIWGVVFMGLGTWCGLGGWKNLRAVERSK